MENGYPKKKTTTKKKMVKKNKVKVTIMVEKEVTLEACPFCGGEAYVSDSSNVEFCITCVDCSVSIYVDHDTSIDFTSDCVERWNRRVK